MTVDFIFILCYLHTHTSFELLNFTFELIVLYMYSQTLWRYAAALLLFCYGSLIVLPSYCSATVLIYYGSLLLFY